MKTKIGILYCIGNISWNQYRKCGRTTQTINKRVSNMQTSLLENCFVIYTTDTLLDTYFYEYLLKQILKKYRVRKNREFFNVHDEEIKEIYETFNYINSIYNTSEKLNWYIQNQYPEYLKKRKYIKSESSSSEKLYKKKLKRQRVLYVDTSEL
jgi:hypothetical protein